MGVSGGGGVRILSGGGEARLVANDTHVSVEASGQVQQRGRLRAVLSAGGFLPADEASGAFLASRHARELARVREAHGFAPRARLVLDSGVCEGAGPDGYGCDLAQGAHLAGLSAAYGEDGAVAAGAEVSARSSPRRARRARVT